MWPCQMPPLTVGQRLLQCRLSPEGQDNQPSPRRVHQEESEFDIPGMQTHIYFETLNLILFFQEAYSLFMLENFVPLLHYNILYK